MTDEELTALIRHETARTDGRVELRCEIALALAARSGRAPGEIGKLCDDNGIRICACQLGCFP
jgi:hypothetical protein